MDQMGPEFGIMLLGMLGLALVAACAVATALAWPLTRGIAPHARRVAAAGLGALGLSQAVLWVAAPSWWRATPDENLTALLLAQAIVCGVLFLIGGPTAAPSSPEA